MHFAIINHDKPDSVDLRMKTREVHLDYLRAAGETLYTAGPILNEDCETPIGSIVIIEADSLDAARAFAAEDPYAKAGLFQSTLVVPWRKTFPGA
ncbi:MAG TPA: YciI family protein [Alphaproteobacteria bacterium]|nr:YciI family protein [Alphaproteobacteria bacterium]